jgi:hypothetical protein
MRDIQKAARERGRDAIEREAHWRRTKNGALVWVKQHQLHLHKADHGDEPNVPKSASESAHYGRQAMQVCISTQQDVVHAMHRKGMGWIDFPWGLTSAEGTKEKPPAEPHGVAHILEERDAEHDRDQQMPDGFKTSQILPMVIAKGSIAGNPGIGSATKIQIDWEGYRVLIARTDSSHWILTGFKRAKK